MEKKKFSLRRGLGLLLTVVMLVLSLGTNAFAVTGSTVAADGVYTSTVTAYKYKYGKLDDTYYGTLNVVVSDGELAGMYITNGRKSSGKSSDKVSKLITNEIYYSYVGKSASVDAINAVDGVSSASVATSNSGTVDSSQKKVYTSNLNDAVIAALKTAPAATGSSGGASNGTAVSTVQGTASVSDSEGSRLVLNIGLDEDGKIVSLTADESSVSDWTSILSKVSSSYVGKTLDEVDTISSATQYSTAVNTAVLAAKADTSYVEPPKIIEGDGAVYTKESNSGLRIVSDADYSTFQSVKVDGTAISSGNYTVSSGSTVVDLNSAYLDTLSTGSHSVGIVSDAGTATGTITVKAAESSGGSGSTPSGGTYTGTVVSSLADGDYIIVDRYSNYYDYSALSNSAAGNSGSGYGFAGEDVTIDGDKATVSTSAAIWTWDSSNKSFYNAASGKYLNLPSDSYSSGAFFSSSPVALTFYTISGNEATVYAPSGNGGYYLNAAYPSGGKAFSSSYARYMNSNYLSSGSGVYFYKVAGVAEQEAAIELDKSSLSLDLGGTGTVTATPTGCSNLTVSSSDSDTVRAEISGNTITLTGVASGTAVITVSGTPDSGYTGPDSVTFTVTVATGAGGTGTGTGEGGNTEITPGNPAYVKTISPVDTVADDYTISLNVTAADATATTTTPGQTATNGTNLVIVIDVSGSIVGKESALNNAIQSLVTGLPENSQVGVVLFNDTASASRVYTASTISGLSFSGVESAGTNMATGISAATSLLNGSGWSNTGNDKAMVIVSDFDVDDYANSINNAKTAKDGGTKIYSVKIDTTSVGAADRTDLNTDAREASIPPLTRYVSSQYPSASAVNESMFGMFNQATVTPGTADNSGTYVYGAGGGNWSEIFNEIKEVQGITTEAPVKMSNVVISDTLSDYVELSGEEEDNYGITVTAGDGSTSDYSVELSGKQISISLSGELTEGTTYTAKIPVTPSEKAQTEANAADEAVSRFASNSSAELKYHYEKTEKTENYKETPQILVAAEATLIYDANAGSDSVTDMPEPSQTSQKVDRDGKTDFRISDAAPTRQGYTFKGWADSDEATEAAYIASDSAKNTVSVTRSGAASASKTVYAVWEKKAQTYTLKYDANGGEGAPEDQTQESAESSVTFTVSETKPTRDGYTFLGWAEKAEATEAAYSSEDNTKDTVSVTNEAADLTKTIYAVWTDNPTVTYQVTGDDKPSSEITVPAAEKHPSGENVSVAAPLTTSVKEKDGVPGSWTFSGWTIASPDNLSVSDGKFTMPAGNVVISGSWSFKPDTYTVTWVDEDETVLETDENVAYGATPTYNGEIPTKTATAEKSFTFAGWNPEIAKVTGDVVYTATYTDTVNQYTVTFVDEDGKTVLKEAKSYDYGTKKEVIEKPEDPKKEEDNEHTYEFAGWDTIPETVTEDIVIKATYKPIPKEVEKYTVTYKDGVNGTVFEDQTTNDLVNGSATPAFNGKPSREGYSFKGWNPAVSETVTTDAVYTAIWEKSYTVDTTIEGHTYEIYQIFTGDLSSTTVGEGDDATTKDILVNLVWGQNGTGTKGTVVDEKIIKALNDVVGENLDTDKLEVIKTYVNTEGDPVQTITTEEGGTASIDLPAGYYLIRDVPNSQDGNDDATTTYITVIVKNYTVSPKSSKPSVKKEVDNDGTYGQTADYAIGDTATFKLTATLPADTNYAEYETYKVMFTDTMSEGLTFGEIKSVTVDGKNVTDVNKYSVTAPNNGSWTLTIDDIKTAAADVNIVDGCEVIVTYTATLNEKAKATNKSGDYDKNGDVNTNSVKLSYSNDPYATGDGSLGQTTTEDYVWVFTYEVDNTKVDGNTNKELPGAGFRLYKGKTEIKLSKDANGMYYPDASGNEEMISGQDGKFNIRGLDAGTYVLRETSVPGGYNKVDDTEITITATHAEEGDNKATLNLGESAVNNKIKNFKGSELPTTGGIGTTIFYVVGGILVIGAGIILVTRRRMAD